MLKLAVIGDPIAHSLSPEIHTEVLARLGISCEYIAVNVKKGALNEWFKRAASEEFDGFNVTMPHKKDILSFMNEISPEAEAYSAVNTVAVRNGKFYGYNTDGRGFLMSLNENGVEVKNKNVVIAGTGGAAATLTKASEMGGASRVIALGRKELSVIPDLAQKTDIFINATPLGMLGCDEWANLSFVNAFPSHTVVYDTIYNPFRTRLLQEAEKCGLVTINGLGMLVCQAILADEYFIK